jgi:hypothetical protein
VLKLLVETERLALYDRDLVPTETGKTKTKNAINSTRTLLPELNREADRGDLPHLLQEARSPGTSYELRRLDQEEETLPVLRLREIRATKKEQIDLDLDRRDLQVETREEEVLGKS